MSLIENSSIGWLARLGASFGGMVFGIIVLFCGTALLWWNEGDYVETRASLIEARNIAQELGDSSRPDPSFNGKLIHASGFADTQDILTDPVFTISTRAIALSRSVEFYQWTEQSKSETKEKLGGGKETITTYAYVKKWVSKPVDSSRFKDSAARQDNEAGVLLPIEHYNARAVNVSFGGYRLPAFLISSIGGAVPLNAELPKTAKEDLARRISSAKAQMPRTDGGTPASPTTPETPGEYVHAQGNTLYIGASPAVPQVGDVRVTFKEIRPAHVSILARVVGDTFERFHASNGQSVGKLSMGTLSMENMFGSAHSGNSFWTWVLRILGTILAIMGLGLLVAPLAIIAAFIPVLGAIVSAGASIVCLFLGLAWSLVIISIAWLRFRPLTGVAMLIIAGGLGVFLFLRGRKKKTVAQAERAVLTT